MGGRLEGRNIAASFVPQNFKGLTAPLFSQRVRDKDDGQRHCLSSLLSLSNS